MIVNLVRRLMILAAIVLAPFYALWVGCGWIADQVERKRWASQPIPS
jgi:cytochrome bd-type quinol oxidase subunit 1